MKYAVIETGGKQYKVTEGSVLDVERLPRPAKLGEVGTESASHSITFSEVLLVNTDGVTKVGQPFVDGVSIAATIVENRKGKKLRVSKFKAKARYRRVTGHRQSLTRIKIETISGEKEKRKAASTTQVSKVEATAPVKKEKVVAKKVVSKKKVLTSVKS